MYPQRALFLTFTVQAFCTFALITPAVLAPVVAPQLGFYVGSIGFLQGWVYLAAMICGVLAGKASNAKSGVTVSQIALACCAGGLLVFSAAQLASWSAWPALIFGGVLLGCGYGLANPSAAKLLTYHTPESRRALVFSTKQAGVPAGIALCGLIVPWLLERMSWQNCLLVVIAGFSCLFGWLHLQHRVFVEQAQLAKSSSGPTSPRKLLGDWSPLVDVFKQQKVRRIALISFVYAGCQGCVLTYLITYLVKQHGQSLAAAAAVMSAGQVASVGFRPIWGLVADKIGNPLTVLIGLGLGMGAALFALAWLVPVGVPLVVLSIFAGATAVAWNGVYYAELTSVADPNEIPSATAGSQFLTFAGAMTAPVIFGAIVSSLVSNPNSYSIAYSLAGASAIVGAALLWVYCDKNQPKA